MVYLLEGKHQRLCIKSCFMQYFMCKEREIHRTRLRYIRMAGCRNHNFSFTTYDWDCNQSITMGVTCGAGTVYPSGGHEYTPAFQRCSCCSIFMCNVLQIVCFCPFVLILLAIVFSVRLRFTDCEYSYGIFKPVAIVLSVL